MDEHGVVLVGRLPARISHRHAEAVSGGRCRCTRKQAVGGKAQSSRDGSTRHSVCVRWCPAAGRDCLAVGRPDRAVAQRKGADLQVHADHDAVPPAHCESVRVRNRKREVIGSRGRGSAGKHGPRQRQAGGQAPHRDCEDIRRGTAARRERRAVGRTYDSPADGQGRETERRDRHACADCHAEALAHLGARGIGDGYGEARRPRGGRCP